MQNKVRAEELLEIINKGKYFTTLKPVAKEVNSYTIPLKVSSYNELNLMVSDLLKASIILLNPDAQSLSSFTKGNNVNVMTLLEIALQLLPEEEMELLDDVRKLYYKE
ncbi:hypothetical protein SAMN06265349_1011065 [Flavobacterium resistens]|uniref:Uncharacterized protein n=1 Tax=Flavobacterium resistens TaxID=443612 RepID=A0A521BHY6_9FLAO|nr:hypothetical protein [Flavobacterium resistens]MRX67380.1 hypothetical protein [Flavobacterium resistens]SMO46702.1 hypothetical protein SAMN06265349_1011065 [Flavobacterium resistens]